MANELAVLYAHHVGAVTPVGKAAGSEVCLEVLGTYGSVVVWRVDGEVVRAQVNEEFTNWGHHWVIPQIPPQEVWLDREAASEPEEEPVYVARALYERALMRHGMRRTAAITQADHYERELRGHDAPRPLYLEALGRAPGVVVWLVSGQAVRDRRDVEFTEGGHDFRYRYIPAGEVWLDDTMEPEDRVFVLLHELNERVLMRQGEGYAEAHAASSKLEQAYRREPAGLAAALEALGYEGEV